MATRPSNIILYNTNIICTAYLHIFYAVISYINTQIYNVHNNVHIYIAKCEKKFTHGFSNFAINYYEGFTQVNRSSSSASRWMDNNR